MHHAVSTPTLVDLLCGALRQRSHCESLHVELSHGGTIAPGPLWVGFRSAHLLVLVAAANGRRPDPVIILGIHDRQTVLEYPLAAGALEFPGIQYLQLSDLATGLAFAPHL